MANPSLRARIMLLVLGLLVATAIGLILTGCTSGGGFLGRFGMGGASPADGDAGNGLPGLLGGAADSFRRLDWWLGLGAGVSILVGVYRSLRGDIPGGAVAVAIGIGLITINALVAVLLPSLFYIVVIGTCLAAAWASWRLATGRSVGGHSLRCVWSWLRTGGKAHSHIMETGEAE